MEYAEDAEIWFTLKRKRKPKSKNNISRPSNTSDAKLSSSNLIGSTGTKYSTCCHACAQYWWQVIKLFSCVLGCRANCNTRVFEAFCDVVTASKELLCDVCCQLNRVLLYLANLTCPK